jgi:outer membrane protein OmpA-like peptidoglycan-associated protein
MGLDVSAPARFLRHATVGLTALTLLHVWLHGWSGLPSARADALRVLFSTRVATGERPKVTVIADQPVDSVDVELTDDRGETLRSSLGALARGARREVPLPAQPGRHRWKGKLVVRQGGTTRDSTLDFETVTAPQLEIAIDKARVDLGARRLEARFSRPAARAEIAVFSATGDPIASDTRELGDQPPGTPLVISWPATASSGDTAADIGRIDLKLVDPDGFYASVSLYPWSVYIPHEEVTFATDSAAIATSEAPKLEASQARIAEALARHKNLGPIRLYIAGHTDTVGAPAYNLSLSQRRAQAIAAWFRKRGLRLPVLYEGFGEFAPLVGTPDQTDEPRNRRVDYILAVEDPVLKATRHRAAWKRLP